MAEEECAHFEEFPVIIEAKDYPIHAWLPHPELVTRGHSTGGEEDLELEMRAELRSKLSLSFSSLCHEFASRRQQPELTSDLNLAFKETDTFMRNLAGYLEIKAWGVRSLQSLQQQ